ncbi:MAG: hypothetical protein WC967_14300 [Balneolaceae bacterium]
MKFLICISLLLSMLLYNTQEKMVDTNFIIMIDDELVLGTIARTSFKIQKNDGSEERIEFFYEPGLLRLSESNFEKINSDTVKSVTMVFSSYRQDSIEVGADEYELDFDRRWFFERYTVLKLYNLDKKKYKKILYPLDDNRNYTFDVYTSNPMTSINRIRKS